MALNKQRSVKGGKGRGLTCIFAVVLVILLPLLFAYYKLVYSLHLKNEAAISGITEVAGGIAQKLGVKPSWTPLPQCTTAQRATQEAGFKAIGHDVWYWGCPKDIWWQLVHKFSPSTSNKVFLDIGMNKGYTAGTWYGLWNPELNLNVKTLFKAIQAIPPNDRQDCGACADCYGHVDPLVPTANDGHIIRVHGVDASEVAYKKNGQILQKFFPHAMGQWTAEWAAASNTVGTVQFAKMDTLDETAAVKAGQEMVDVKMVNVPHIMNDLKVNEVFVLKMDTEGNDPKVLLGAEPVIDEHRATLVFFEYHKLGFWKSEYSLQQFTEWFEVKGYACYFLGHMCAMRLTGCWSDVFEYRDWSNIMCVSMYKAMPLVDTMNKYSYAHNDKCERGGN